MGEYLRLQYPDTRSNTDTWRPTPRRPHRGALRTKDLGLRSKTSALSPRPSPNRRRGLPPEHGTFLHRLWIFLLNHPDGVRIAAMAEHLSITRNNQIRGSLNELRRRCFARALVGGVWTGLRS